MEAERKEATQFVEACLQEEIFILPYLFCSTSITMGKAHCELSEESTAAGKKLDPVKLPKQ